MLQPKKPVVKKTTKKTKSVSERLGDVTLRDIKNAGEDTFQLITLGGYGKIKKAFGGEYKHKKIGEKKYGGKISKAKNGTSLGMKSVKAGFDKNPGVTRADIITAAKGKAKNGKPVKKALLGGIVDGIDSVMMGKNGKTVKKAKSGTIVKKAQRGTKLKLSERYSKTADSLWSESNRKMKEAGKVTVDSKERRWKQKSDSLVKSADKDFKGGLQARQKEFELRKKGMRTGGSMKKCRYGCK